MAARTFRLLKGMEHLEPVPVGFFPKHIQTTLDWLENEAVREICSVSLCISKGPDHWIDQWKHNLLGFYDSEEIASQVIGEDELSFDFFAYKLYPFRCLEGKTEKFIIPTGKASSIPDDYEFLGFDIVTKSTADFFECSPLSCNAGAKEYPANEFCLISDRETAITVLTSICQKGTYEPGPYYLFEVYRRRAL